MELQEAIRGRRSVRKYLDKSVEMEKIKRIIESGLWAPFAYERWRFVVVTDPDKKKRISRQRHIWQAPVDIVVFADLKGASKRDAELYAIQETAAAIQNMLLTAFEEGLSTCWNGSFDDDEVCKLLKAPKGYKPVAVISLGYPAEQPEPPQRRPFEQVVGFDAIIE